jgi:hypothetical protein
MTSVVCAGDGYLSNGLYKGIANNAELVLLKVMDDVDEIYARLEDEIDTSPRVTTRRR